jgi:hypothetical protein
MLRGHIDNITSTGCIEGWAFDTSRPTRPLAISVVHDEIEIASGLANLYRGDLVDAGCGVGWCAYSLKADQSPLKLRKGRVSLRNRDSGEEISSTINLPFKEVGQTPMSSVSNVVALDPTLISEISQLNGCAPIFAEFIRRYGVEPFVRTAYAYILGRTADPSGLANYAGGIRKGIVTPLGLLVILWEGSEFRKGARQLPAPNSQAFPFFWD